jgi:hypothetical protein
MAVNVGVGVCVRVGVALGVLVNVGVGVRVAVGVAVRVAVGVFVLVGEAVGVCVGVGVRVGVGEGVGVSVGCGEAVGVTLGVSKPEASVPRTVIDPLERATGLKPPPDASAKTTFERTSAEIPGVSPLKVTVASVPEPTGASGEAPRVLQTYSTNVSPTVGFMQTTFLPVLPRNGPVEML